MIDSMKNRHKRKITDFGNLPDEKWGKTIKYKLDNTYTSKYTLNVSSIMDC